jgi:c(7)-type cytochrome triheme protein
MKFLPSFSLVLAMLLAPMTATALDIKEITYTTKDAGKVIFSHNIHMKQKMVNSNCKSCHDNIYDMKKKSSYTMAQMEKGKSCGACHDGSKAFPLKDCSRCHKVKEISYLKNAGGATKFSHEQHLTKYQCGACHPSIFAAGPNKRATMADMEKGKSCGACHNGKKAFPLSDCGACHQIKEVTFKIKETGPVKFSHTVHTKKQKCNDCHAKIYPMGDTRRYTMADMENGKSCGACHNGKPLFSVSECAKCHPVKELSFKKIQGAGPASFSHVAHLNKKVSCSACHTKVYPLGRSNKVVTMEEMYNGKSCGVCHDGKQAFSSKDWCVKCHDM